MNILSKQKSGELKAMTSKTSPRKALTAAAFKACLAASITLVIGSYAQPTQAQWLTQDNSAILKAMKEYAEQAKRWAKTAAQYKATIDHYTAQVAFWQEQLVKLQAINFQLFALQNQFKRIPDDYGMTDECPGVSGGISGDITTALQSFLPNMGGDVVKQQKQLCQLIVLSKNAKYNMTVDYLQFVAAASKDLNTIQTDRMTKVNQSPGNLEAIAEDAQRYGENLDTAREHWETNMAQQDTQIKMLQQMQSILARRAMNGQPSPLGTLVNVAAMKAAFSN